MVRNPRSAVGFGCSRMCPETAWRCFRSVCPSGHGGSSPPSPTSRCRNRHFPTRHLRQLISLRRPGLRARSPVVVAGRVRPCRVASWAQAAAVGEEPSRAGPITQVLRDDACPPLPSSSTGRSLFPRSRMRSCCEDSTAWRPCIGPTLLYADKPLNLPYFQASLSRSG